MSMTELQAAKLIAETAEITARTARAEEAAQQARERADLRRKSLQLSVELAEVELAKSKLSNSYEELALQSRQRAERKEERDERLLLADWRYSHTVNFVGSVAKDTVIATIEKLHQYSVMDPGCDITLTFNSPGGSVIDGMALFDYIRFLRGAGHKVTIIALGYAASMAGILLQAADVRVMAKGSWLLIHELAFSAGGKVGEVEDMYKFGLRLKEQAARIFVERSGGKLSRDVLEQKWLRTDWWLDPEEALGLGLIDEIQ